MVFSLWSPSYTDCFPDCCSRSRFLTRLPRLNKCNFWMMNSSAFAVKPDLIAIVWWPQKQRRNVIATVGIHHRNYAHCNADRSCLLIYGIAVIRSLSLGFIDEFEENSKHFRCYATQFYSITFLHQSRMQPKKVKPPNWDIRKCQRHLATPSIYVCLCLCVCIRKHSLTPAANRRDIKPSRRISLCLRHSAYRTVKCV